MQDINLYHLLKFYAKNWLWIAALTIFGVLTGFVYNNFIQVPLYKSDATLILISPADKQANQDSTLINNYVELFKSRRVLDPVIAKQNFGMKYEDLVKSIEATNQKNTAVIKIAITTNNPNNSKSLVEGAVVSFKEQVTQLYSLDNVQVVDNASLADKPFNVNKQVLLALSSAAGLIASFIILFFVYDFKLSKNELLPEVHQKVSKKISPPKPKIAKLAKLKAFINTLIGNISSTRAVSEPAKKSAPKRSVKKSTAKQKVATKKPAAKSAVKKPAKATTQKIVKPIAKKKVAKK